MTRLDIGRMFLASLLAIGAVSAQFGVGMAKADSVGCENRSAAHVAQHGGIDADSRWHVAHGDLPNCKDEQPAERHDDSRHEDDDKRDDNGPAIHHGDEPGIHCRFLVMCG